MGVTPSRTNETISEVLGNRDISLQAIAGQDYQTVDKEVTMEVNTGSRVSKFPIVFIFNKLKIKTKDKRKEKFLPFVLVRKQLVLLNNSSG